MDAESEVRHPPAPGFSLDPQRPIGEELDRVLGAQVEAARKALQRLSRKRLRRAGVASAAMERIAAVAGLLAAADPDCAAAIHMRLQPAMARIEPWRRAWVRRGLFDRLFAAREYAAQPVFAQLRALCRELPGEAAGAAKPSPKAAAAAASADLEALPRAVRDTGAMAGFSVADLRAGLSGSYADCQRRLRAADAGDPESREWARRQLECHYQQLQLLGALAGPLRGAAADYRRLAGLLALDGGLADLRARLRAQVRVRNEALYQPFIDVLADRRQLLRLQIESLGADLFGL